MTLECPAPLWYPWRWRYPQLGSLKIWLTLFTCDPISPHLELRSCSFLRPNQAIAPVPACLSGLPVRAAHTAAEESRTVTFFPFPGETPLCGSRVDTLALGKLFPERSCNTFAGKSLPFRATCNPAAPLGPRGFCDSILQLFPVDETLLPELVVFFFFFFSLSFLFSPLYESLESFFWFSQAKPFECCGDPLNGLVLICSSLNPEDTHCMLH